MAYRHQNTTIRINDNLFSIVFGTRLLKTGHIERRPDAMGERLVLIDSEGKSCSFYLKNDGLEARDGTRYEKV